MKMRAIELTEPARERERESILELEILSATQNCYRYNYLFIKRSSSSGINIFRARVEECKKPCSGIGNIIADENWRSEE
jgi:hypothetical protein